MKAIGEICPYCKSSEVVIVHNANLGTNRCCNGCNRRYRKRGGRVFVRWPK